jgi:hypothetical protein
VTKRIVALAILIPIVLMPVVGWGAESSPPDSVRLEVGSRREARADRNAAAHRPRPKSALWRSAAVPGWGQLYNRRPIKALLVSGGQIYLAARAVSEHQLAGRLEDRARSISDTGLADQKWRERNRALGRRDDFIWWSAFALLFSMAEAYVDASLMGFGDEFEGVREESPVAPGPRIAFNVSFD